MDKKTTDKEISKFKIKNHTDHTEGSILSSILKMGLPSMIGFGIGNIYDLVDMYWLSRLGPEPVAAITILGPALWVIHSANSIVGVGSVAIISRRYGEQDYEKTEMAIKETILLKWLAAIFFGILGYILAPYLMRLLGAKGDVITMGTDYARIIFIGMGFNFATYSVFTAMRGVSNPNIAMALMISLSGLNLVLDPFMIFGWWIFPAWGVKGAAWASVISYAVAFIVGVAIMCSGGTNVRLRIRTGHRIRWITMWKILKIGAPSAIGQLSFSLGRMVIMPMIAMFGTGVVAAYGVSQRVTALGVMLLVGIGLGLSALIGHNLGAKKFERARWTATYALRLTTSIMTILGIASAVFARQIMGMFFTDPEIIGYGISLLRIFALGAPFLGMWLMIENIYTGAGENRPAMVFNMIHSWALEIPAVLICTQLLNLNHTAVWWSMTAALSLSAIGYYIYYRRGGWLKVKV